MRNPIPLSQALAAGLALTLVAPSFAATEAERLKALETRLEQSQQLIELLQRRLAQVEGRVGVASAPAVASAPVPPVPPAPVAQAPAAAAEGRVEALERQVGELATSMASAKPADTGVPLHGFLDVGWARHSGPNPQGTANGHRLGVLDLYLTPQLGGGVRSLIELAFEYGEDGTLAIDAERLQIGYEVSDNMVLWAGRFHTPYGYWNTAFHHGAQIQTSITRPKLIAFEDQGGILPSHSVGLWATGKLASGAGRVSYDLYLANGNRIKEGVLDYNAGGDDNGNSSVGFNLGVSPRAVPGLTLGLHGQRQTVNGENEARTAQGGARMQFLGGYGFYENDDWELIGEYYRFKNRSTAPAGGTFGSNAWFAQGSYNLAAGWAVFARVEKARLDANDPYFALQSSGTSYDQKALGLRYDLGPRAALKLQLDRRSEPGSGLAATSWLRAQYAIRF